MASEPCERCERHGAFRVGRRVWLCAPCIERALAARFPIYGLPLQELAAALAELAPEKATGT